LGGRGLYNGFGSFVDGARAQQATLWVLNLSDGHNSLLDIAERSGLTFDDVRRAAHALVEHELLEECRDGNEHARPGQTSATRNANLKELPDLGTQRATRP